METITRTHVQKESMLPSDQIDQKKPAPTGVATRWAQTTILLLAPAVMAAGLLYHPHIGNPTDADFLATLAAAVSADTVRWAVAHLLVAVGSALILLAFLALHNRLRVAGEHRWSALSLPFIVLGSVFYALLPAMEFVPLAAADSGNDIQAAQGALFPWFIPTLFTAAGLFLMGALGYSIALFRGDVLPRPLTWVVVIALLVMATARMVPLGLVQMQVQSLAGLLAFWPLAYGLSKSR